MLALSKVVVECRHAPTTLTGDACNISYRADTHSRITVFTHELGLSLVHLLDLLEFVGSTILYQTWGVRGRSQALLDSWFHGFNVVRVTSNCDDVDTSPPPSKGYSIVEVFLCGVVGFLLYMLLIHSPANTAERDSDAATTAAAEKPHVDIELPKNVACIDIQTATVAALEYLENSKVDRTMLGTLISLCASEFVRQQQTIENVGLKCTHRSDFIEGNEYTLRIPLGVRSIVADELDAVKKVHGVDKVRIYISSTGMGLSIKCSSRS
jgi:hypothetical protein